MQQNCKIVKSKKIYVNDSNLIIDIGTIELHNDEVFEIIICQNIPQEANENNTIQIQIGNKMVSLYNVTGNYTRADQIHSRTKYIVAFGVDPLHISLLKRIYRSKFKYSNINFN